MAGAHCDITTLASFIGVRSPAPSFYLTVVIFCFVFLSRFPVSPSVSVLSLVCSPDVFTCSVANLMANLFSHCKVLPCILQCTAFFSLHKTHYSGKVYTFFSFLLTH